MAEQEKDILERWHECISAMLDAPDDSPLRYGDPRLDQLGILQVELAKRVAAGYVIVPKEPTEEMLDRAMRKLDPTGNENYVTREDLLEAYRAMIDARPR